MASTLPTIVRDATDEQIVDVARRSLRYLPALGLTYVNNQKAGCSTVKQSMWMASGVPYGKSPYKRNGSPFVASVAADPATLEGFRASRIFSIVRNPFARALSGYLDLVNRPDSGAYKSVGRRLRARHGVEPETLGFTELMTLIGQDDPWAVNPHFAPQVVNLLVGHIAYDHVGHLERIDETFARYGLSLATFDRHGVGAAERLSVYDDGAAVDVVRRIYADDFATFGYTTDPAAQSPVGVFASEAVDGARLLDLLPLLNEPPQRLRRQKRLERRERKGPGGGARRAGADGAPGRARARRAENP